MPARTARTAWTGTLEQGSGKVELASSGIGTYGVSFPKRAADDADGPRADGGFAITGIKITVRGAEAAKAGCPVSKALAGTTITLDAGLK